MSIPLKLKHAIDKTFALPTGESHELILSPPKVFVLDVEDSHFNFDRAVLLPDLTSTDGSTPVLDARRVTGLGVIYAAHVHARSHATQGVFVTGHTDASGAAGYNQRLSEERAKNVSLLLRGKRDDWRKLSAKDDAVDDYQTILRWQHQRAGWDCDPGAISNKLDKQTRIAIGAFQERYNLEVDKAQQSGLDSPFKKKIDVDKSVGPETWGAFYDIYMTELMDLLDLKSFSALEKLQAQIKPPSEMPDFVGCGEHIPFNPARRKAFEKGTDEHLEGPQKNPPDRRVEILFFDPGEEVKTVCHPKPGQCKPDLCPVYIKAPHKQVPIGIPKGLTIAEVNLRLTFVDPDGKVRPFPEGLEVEAKFGDPDDDPGLGDPDGLAPPSDDASDEDSAAKPSKPAPAPGADPDAESMEVDQEPNEKVGPDGLLQFVIPRKTSSLYLRILTADQRHFVTADPKKLDDQKIENEKQALDGIRDGRVWFRLPPEFNTRQGYFELPEPQPGVTFKDGAFLDIDNRATQIGSRDKPLELRLNIHWQYFQFEYFDRWTSSTVSVPQLHGKDPGSDAAVPLVMDGDSSQVEADGAVAAEAQAAWAIQVGNDTVHCLAWLTRSRFAAPSRVVPDDKCTVRFRAPRLFIHTEGDGSTANAPRKLVGFASGDKIPDTPGVDRLRLYDLPAEWRSRVYPARLADETRDKIRAFEQVAATASTLAKPYVISLDTIVMQGSNARADTTIRWNDGDLAARFTLFDNQLQVYKPDPASGDPSFTRLADLKPQPSGPVLNDFPSFTRLIARGVILYDVFDARTEARAAFKGAPVGARLAQRLSPGGSKVGIATVFGNTYDAPAADGTEGGTFSLGQSISAILRCCGHDKAVELFHVIQYLSVSVDFPSTISPADVQSHPLLKTAVPFKSRPDDADELARKFLAKIADRWNGGDDVNKDPVTFEIGNPVTARGRYLALLHRGARGPGPAASGELRVNILKEVRAFVSDREGFWAKDDTSPDGEDFGAAHEIGHILSLPDEYSEPAFQPSLGQPGITEGRRSPGMPYSLDFTAMMNGNRRVRTRYFWDLMLFACDNGQFTNAKDIVVRHGRRKFSADITPPAKSRVRFPMLEKLRAEVSRVGFCDLLVYVTGQDEYTADEIDPSASAKPYDGLIMVRVRMKWDLGAKRDLDELKDFMNRAHVAIHKAFNNPMRLAVRATLGGRDVRLRVLFAPRFICSTIPEGSEADEYMGKLFPPLATPLATSYAQRVTDLVKDHPVHVNVVLGSGPFEVKADKPQGERTAHVRNDGRILLIFSDSRFDDDVVSMFSQMVGLAGAPRVAGDFTPLLGALPPELSKPTLELT